MKRLPFTLLVLLLCISPSLWAVDIYVSPHGSDANEGSVNQPLATISAALRKARTMRRLNNIDLSGGIHIILQNGLYVLQQTIVIRPEDAGSALSPTFIEAAPGAHPVISGGIKISQWKKLETKVQGLSPAANGHVYMSDWPGTIPPVRELWVNGEKAVCAKSSNGDSMQRILNWDKATASCWIPTPQFAALQQQQKMEMFIHQWWAIAILRIKQMVVHGDSTQLFFKEPESTIQNEHPWPAPWLSKETGNSAFYLTNALPFLDEPGEWYIDETAHKIYYWPGKGEDMVTATVTAPVLETLIEVKGTADHPVHHLFVSGIEFSYTGWLRPSQKGHVPHQAGMYMTEAYTLNPPGTPLKKTLDNQAWVGRPAAAVLLNYADNTAFLNCRFTHLASTALDAAKGTHYTVIKGNVFSDIGGTAILAGPYSDAATEIHLPYQPKDEREVCDSLIISNNFITNATNEDWSCVGIGLGYTRNSLVTHNEVENVSYTGISMGWGWNDVVGAMHNNRILANYIHHYGKHNYDCSGIYTLSAQPGSEIAYNVVDSIYKAPYAHLLSHWFYLYADEGSSGFRVHDNWTPSEKYLQNANGPNNVWANNGAAVNRTIKDAAGLEQGFDQLSLQRTSPYIHQPINYEHAEVIELVASQTATVNITELKALLVEQQMDSGAVYQWQNHYVIFDTVKDVLVLKGKLKKAFPGVQVKWYPDLFYHFSRKYCSDTVTAREWDHVILTCNLVADEKKQKEYLQYHATQFQQWPEISKGFCNADFQQLLIFKNGRQLILVISIPKGETLDHLNPKTTENNPRVNDWNKLMGQYQEGIEGTKKGEVWVLLKKV
ncbi:MAG: L-rhamnose mutarotase [Bacteroidetes bacterium]|nr:L-rhamnose mutarotase [Bacteroidota bacterium]